MISPGEVHKAAKKKERENLRFRSFLKNHTDDEELDRQFLALYNELFEGMTAASAPTAAVHIVRYWRMMK